MSNSGERVAELKDRLAQALKMRNLKAIELSEKTDIPKGAISYYLAGKSQPKADRLYIISKALDISETWLLGYDVAPERTQSQKKNDDLVKIIARLRKDNEFYNLVSGLDNLSAEQYESIKQLVLTLVQQ